MATLTWHTVDRKICDLVPNINNPRTMSPKQMDDLKRSLKKYGVVELPVIDFDNTVIAGHQRLLALKLLGREQESIHVRMPNRKLTKKEYDQYLLGSNRIHGDWDWQKLADNFDIDTLLVSGFDDVDMAHIFDDLEVTDDEFNVEKELVKIETPKSKLGDVYQLGRHRIICGDCTKPETLTKLMNGVYASTVLSDPPFNISLNYDKGVGGNRSYGGKVKDDKSDEDYKAFLKSALSNALAVTTKNAHVFTYCDQKYVWLLQTLYSELSISNKRVCLWIKNNHSPTPQVAFNKCYEPCVYGTIGNPYMSEKILNLNEVMNKEVGVGNRTLEDIHDLLDIWMVKRLTVSDYEHPTEKPPQLHEKALRRCTKPGDIVLDCFGGSGSLLIACEQLQRTAYIVECSPTFIDLIIRRYEKLTGDKAKKV